MKHLNTFFQKEVDFYLKHCLTLALNQTFFKKDIWGHPTPKIVLHYYLSSKISFQHQYVKNILTLLVTHITSKKLTFAGIQCVIWWYLDRIKKRNVKDNHKENAPTNTHKWNSNAYETQVFKISVKRKFYRL